MFVTTASIGDTILSALWGFLLTIDGLIYNLICYVTEIFNSLVKLNVFTNDSYNDIVSRIYIVLGLIMLFVLAYSLLKAIINPENFSKGETSFSKLIGNTVSSLIIIAILPTVFSVAFNIQNSLVNQGTIYKIILGNDSNNSSSTDKIKVGGRQIAYYTFTSFFYENDQSDGGNTDSSENSYDNIKDAVEGGDSFTKFSTLSEKVVDKSITYMFPVSTIAGIVILYILLNFCFDVAVRVVKLAFYQIIAPIPVMCRIIPGGKMKDVFSKWLKQVISLFVEVFIRMAAIAFGVKFVQIIVSNKDSLNIDASTGARRIVMALLIMAVVIFIKQIPKIIGDMFGIDTAGMKLGLMDKLAMGGGLMAAAATGGLGLGAVRNFAKSRRDGKGILSSVGSALTGGLAAGIGAGYGARKAKNFCELKSATSKGLSGQMAHRNKVENYIAKRKNEPGGVSGALWNDFTGWLTGKGVEDLDRIITASGDVNKANDAFRGAAKKQWDKHSTDGAIVYDAGTDASNNFFKGAGRDRMFGLYNTYRDSDGNMRSASFIRDSIEQRKAEMRNRDLNYYLNQERQRLGVTLNAPNREDFYSSMTDSSGNRVFNEAAYNQAVSDYNSKMTEAQNTAQSRYDSDLADLSYLDSMYTQLEKKSITEIGRAALEGRDIGTITAADLFETKEYGETAQRVIRDSGLEKFDPAKNEKVEVKDGDYATFIDDMASAASKQAGHAAREKQNYLEKKKSS